MKRALYFAKRNFKEIVRDPLGYVFILGMPIVILIFITCLNNSVIAKTGGNVSLFEISNLTPGILVFGFSFITLFSALIVSKDRTSSFLNRLYASPMRAFDFVVGYTLPFLVIAVIQSIILFAVALCCGLSFTFNIFISIIVSLPIAVLFIALGILIGTWLNESQTGGFSSMIVSFSSLASGLWFDISLMGKTVEAILSYVLPFANAVNASRFALSGQFSEMWFPLLFVILYTTLVYIISVYVFKIKTAKK